MSKRIKVEDITKVSNNENGKQPEESEGSAMENDITKEASSENVEPFDKESDEVDSDLSMSEAGGVDTGDPEDVGGVDREYVERLERESKENYDKYLRAVAELENFKKRAIKERSELLRYSGEHLARDLLPVVDNLLLADRQGEAQSVKDVLDGIALIIKQFEEVLNRHSIKGESALGAGFDPNKHEAVATVKSDEDSGIVVEELKKAYFFKDKLLRPAQVVVSE